MIVYLAGEHPVKNGTQIKSWQGLNILESFYYAGRNCHFKRLLETGPKNFLLDSGAFTFLQGNEQASIIDAYADKYAEFINRHNIQHFFELDVDVLVGLEKVEKIRNRLQALTGKRPIPVWHLSRGKQYFIDLCKSYKYVALGGIAIKELTDCRFFSWFISQAHKAGTKIHGLGFTQLPQLKKYHFDSVDSTAWLYGNRGGFLYRFNPAKPALMEKIQKPAGTQLKSCAAAAHNFREWAKLTRWAERNL